MINHNRKTVSGDDKSRAVIDLSGRSSRRKPKLPRHQGYSSLHYKKGTALYADVAAAWTLYDGGDAAVATRFAQYLNPKALPNKPLSKHLAFQQAYMRECLELASPETLDAVDRHIDARYEKDNALSAAPWLKLKHETDVEDPIVQRNVFFQQYVSSSFGSQS